MVLSSQLPNGGRYTSDHPRSVRPSVNAPALQEPKNALEAEKLAREGTTSRPPMGWLGAMGLLLGTVIFWCGLFKLVFYVAGLLQH